MSTLNLTNTTLTNFTCDISDNSTHCLSPDTSLSTDMSLSSFEIIFIAACSSFLTLIFAGLFNFLKINITQQQSEWIPPSSPNFNAIIQKIRKSYLPGGSMSSIPKQSTQVTTDTMHGFPPQNRYYPIVASAYKLFIEAINGTERDGWVYLGEKKGVKKYKKDIHNSPFSLYRGEKILDYPQNLLINAIRDKRIRLLVGDGQMRDCGPLEIIDDNCKIEFEEYKSPAPFVGAREFVYIDTIHRLSDGTILSFARSVLHPGRMPCNKFTRADLKIAGWAFKQIPDEPNKTKVLYLVRCDLGGSVPSWLINQITSDIPITVERLNSALKKIGDVEQFNKPLMDVLLYGPNTQINDDINNEIIMGNGHNSNSYIYPLATEEQKQRYAQILRENDRFWNSREYLDLIPKNDGEWFKRTPKLINGTRKQHEILLDNFIPPDKPFQYSNDLNQAFKLFNQWRKWENGKEWKEKAQKEDLKIYSHSLPNESIDIIKGEAMMPYSVPIIAGILLNPSHRKKWDGKLDELIKIGKSSEYTHLMYLSVKTPTIFITYRDMIALTFIYPFIDGSLIMGSRSIKHKNYPPKKTRVRANINLDIWHIRPNYDKNIKQTIVTHYAHVSLGGSLPNWIVNEASIDMPSGILKVRKYINDIYHQLHKPGVLNIPPWPYLKSMGIDIGWMDRDPNNKLSVDIISDNGMEEKTETKDESFHISNATNYEEEKGNIITSNINKKRSPALNYVSDRQRKLSGTDIIDRHISDKPLSTTSSSLIRKRTPNYNLMIANPTMSQTHSHSQSSRDIITPKSINNQTPLSLNNNNKLIITRQQWEKGGVNLRLHEINNDKQDEKEECKYSLNTNLSVRDTASYKTLGIYAASELLQQTDASSKEYWVPSESKTPRGIFVYKFIHSGERYYHYMGKAILHHEPKFIFDAICDPTFRFQYDKMLDEMQIIDKLDNQSYIARLSHTNKQCYIKQQRETLIIVRHKIEIPNDKYVAAGVSIEHKDYPTEIGMKYGQLNNNNDNDDDRDDISRSKHSKSESMTAKQLSGKGPSKSLNSGILRIDIKSSGWVIERNVKKPTDSIVSYITNINFGGSLPSALLKTIAKKQPLAIFYLGKALKQRAKALRKQKRALRRQRSAQMQMQQQQQQS